MFSVLKVVLSFLFMFSESRHFKQTTYQNNLGNVTMMNLQEYKKMDTSSGTMENYVWLVQFHFDILMTVARFYSVCPMFVLWRDYIS